MNPSFASSHIKNLSSVIIEECMTFRATLNALAKTGKAFDMEAKGAELIFDVIARVIYNFPLDAQRSGSQTLSDLRELVNLVEAGLSMNPIVKAKAWWRRANVKKRVDAAVRGKILERYELLKAEKVVPSRKDPYSTLDLMLREQLMRTDGEGVNELDPEFEKLLITKCDFPTNFGSTDILY
jgi:cytochrome P450